jgi:transposase
VYLPPDPASRTRYVAGEIAQQDFWFPDIELPVGSGQTRTAKQLPVLTMVCGYSPLVVRAADPHPLRRRPVRRLVAALVHAWRGAPGVGAGWGRGDRPLA